MSTPEKVLVIDDDRLVRNIVKRALASHYETQEAACGEEGLTQAKATTPDYILLDVEMPGMNGYEVCDALKLAPETCHIPILFVSSRSSLRERLLGYEVGGADFITKPFEAEVLLAKLRLLGTYMRDKQSLGQQAEMASKTAFLAMKGSSELGLAIQFIEATYAARSLEEIAKKFFSVTTSLGLSCTLMIHQPDNPAFFSSRGTTSPLEKELITTLFSNDQRFVDFGFRTQINYPLVALLVKNMPLDDQETYGRFKDFLPTMLGATNEKIKSLLAEKALKDQTHNLNNSFNAVRETLRNVGSYLQSSQTQALMLLRDTFNEMENRIPTLGLEDDQEKYLINTLDHALESTKHIIESGEEASHSFDAVCRLLDHLSERQRKLLAYSREEKHEVKQEVSPPENDFTGDVELF